MTKPKKRTIHFLLASISAILVFALIFTSYGSVFGVVAAYGSKYISEVKLFYGKTLDEAIEHCESADYIPVKKNVNHSASGDLSEYGIYIVGYKTTDNPDEGITDISLLQMNSGYQDYTYGDVAERAMEKLGNVPTELSYAVDEFADNYENKSPAAIAAVNVLNCYHIDEMNNMKLGDYMVSGDCNVDFIKKLMSRSSTAVVSAFCNALVAGVADYGDENWATRIGSSKVKSLLNGDNDEMLDVQYKVLASELVSSLQEFSKGYNEAKDRYDANNKKVEKIDADSNDVTDIPEKTVEDMTTGGEIKTEDGDTYFLVAYEVLNQYNYDETTKLGDYIVSLGNSTYDEFENLRKIYPLVDSLTDGQLATMRLSGVAFSAFYLRNDSGIIDEANKQLKSIKESIKSGNGGESMSIWIGTDQTVYNQKVAVTKDAYRANSAGQIYNTLTTPDDLDTFLSEAQSKINIVMTVVGICYVVTGIVTKTIVSFVGFMGAASGAWAVCCAGVGAGVFSTIFGLLGCAIIILNYVALVALIVILIVMLVKYLWELYHDDDEEAFTDIPSVMYDEAQNRYVRYDLITIDLSATDEDTLNRMKLSNLEGMLPKNYFCNINGTNARRWNALYTTKSKYLGDPICSSEINDLIVVQYDNNITPQGYKAVKCFGEVSAANLNANSRADSASVYMFYKSTANEINEGEEEKTTTGTQYISKLSLSVESSETAAKAALTKSGYKVLDVNLTPSTASIKKYTYVGFATTTNANDAVTDIRISARNSASAYLFGNASYTSCGTTATGDTLYYTSYKSAGSPILADLTIRYSLDDVPTGGYEPVNMFCGGNAFNFNCGGTEVDNSVERAHRSQTAEHWNDKGTYLYFKPSVTYTYGAEYISGIVLVAGNPNGEFGDSASDYMKALNLKRFDADLTSAAKVQLPSEAHGFASNERWCANIATYICYTTTHNPYRAIYGIKSYASAPGNYYVPTNLGNLTSGSYAVCDVFFELPYLVSGGSAKKYYLRGVYETHSYQFASCSGTLTGLQQLTPISTLAPEDYEDVEWSSSNVRGKGLYVLGPVEGGTPLSVDDIKVTSDTTVPEGYIGVQDFKTPSRTAANNLGYKTDNSKYISTGKKSNPVYMYVKQEAPVQKKYISSIAVSTYTIDKVAGTDLSQYDKATINTINAGGNEYCMQTLLSQCTDEVIQTNIALERSKTNYSNPSTIASAVSYIGVSRTDSSTEAITGIIKYVTSSKEVPSIIQVGGVSYTKAGDMVLDPKGSYYLYYTTSTSSNPGMPLTSISISEEVFAPDSATAMSTKSVDKSRTEVTASLYGDPEQSTFIHMEYADSTTYMGAIYIGHGKTKKEAQCNLLSLGCNICVDMDLNDNTGGEYVYMGYSRYKLQRSEIRKGVALYAVRDIILTVGEPHKDQIVVNGLTYTCAIDEYNIGSDSDGTKGVSLNSGTGGKQIYLYYTSTMTKATAYPIDRLGLASKDYGMINNDSNKWEHIFDANGNRVNLNEGAIATIDDGKHIADNRIYLYASRTDNAVKEGCEVDMNSINNEFIAYDVYMKGA